MEQELYHFGIKGMKWGVRRTPEQLGHRTASKKKSFTSTELAKKLFTKKSKVSSSTSSLSDADLQKRIDRLTLEKKAKDLETSLHPQKHSAVKELLGRAGKNLATKVLDKLVDKTANKLFEQKFDIDDYTSRDTKQMSPDDLKTATNWYQNAIALRKAQKSYKDPDGSGGHFDIDAFVSRDTHKMTPDDLQKASKWFKNANELDKARETYENNHSSHQESQSSKKESSGTKKHRKNGDPLDQWQWSSVDGMKVSTRVRR